MAGGTPSSGVAIVGSGGAGLHLALLLQKQGIPVTIYSDKTAAQLASGRMLNTVAHHNTTVKREQALGVDHWDLQEYGYLFPPPPTPGGRTRFPSPARSAPRHGPSTTASTCRGCSRTSSHVAVTSGPGS